MPLFSPSTLDQVRNANDIVDVIGAVLPLKRAGANFVALCPFHKEKTPSFHVTPSKQIFHCFGCHKGGDVFTFIKEYENLSFGEAVKRLAERAKIPLQIDSSPGDSPRQFLKDKLLEVHEQLTQRWQAALLNDVAGGPAREYLASRGVTEEAVKLFRLGFAPDSWEDTVNWAKSKGFDLPLVEQAGLISKKEGGANYYARFRRRLMFPICDEQGRVIGFSGRVLPGDDDERKYVNSPETPLFTKSRVIFGLDKSKRALLDRNFAIICEGQLDLISCYMAGVQNVVAPQGTALTAEHTRILKRYVPEVVLCFDSDTAGQKAAVRALDDLIGSGLSVRVATLPAPHDPDSFIKNFGADAFLKLIQDAEPFFDYYLNRLCALNDVNSDAGRKAVAAAMADALQKTGDEMLLDKYARKTAARCGIAALNAQHDFKKLAGAKQPAFARPKETDATQEDDSWRPITNEFWLLKLALMDDELLDWLSAHLDLGWVQNPFVREILEHRIAQVGSGQDRQVAAIFSDLLEDHSRSLFTEALADQRNVPNRPQQLNDLVMKLRNNLIDREIGAITQRLSEPNLDSAQITALLMEQTALKRAKAEPLRPIRAGFEHPLAEEI